MTSQTEYSTQTPKKSTLFSGQYLRNHWTMDIGVLGYIGIVWPKEHSPEVLHVPPVTPCIDTQYRDILIYIQQDATWHSLFISGNCSTCFGWYLHPSSGAHTTLSTASGTCQTVTATCCYRGRVVPIYLLHKHASRLELRNLLMGQHETYFVFILCY